MSAGPGLLLSGVVCATGFGLHAADDWHRHGEMGAGFFHLHFHVGDHVHPDLERSAAISNAHPHSGQDHHHGHGAESQAGQGAPAAHAHHTQSSSPRPDPTGTPEACPSTPHQPDREDRSKKRQAFLYVPHAVQHLGHGAPCVATIGEPVEITASESALLPRVSWHPGFVDPRGPPA